MNGLTRDRQFLYRDSEHLLVNTLADDTSFDEAERIIDTNICILIDQSKIPDKEACLARIMAQIHGSHSSYEEIAACRADVLTQYGFAENLHGIGAAWKQVIWDGQLRRLEYLIDWIRHFREEMMPVINEIIGAYETECGVSQTERQKQYKAYGAMLNSCKRELETVAKILPLIPSNAERLSWMPKRWRKPI